MLLVVGLASCGGPSLEIVSPSDGDTITGDVVLRVHGDELPVNALEVNVDYEITPRDITYSRGGTCHDCTFEISYPGTEIANGEHTLSLYYETDIGEGPTDEVRVVFARP